MTITKTKNPHRVHFNSNASWIRQFITAFSLCRARFDPRPVLVALWREK